MVELADNGWTGRHIISEREADVARLGLLLTSSSQPAARIALLAVVAMTVAGCSRTVAGTPSPPTLESVELLDRGAVERDVAAQFEEREGVAIDLACEDEMRVEVGATYACSGTTARDEYVALQITITAEDPAAYIWAEV